MAYTKAVSCENDSMARLSMDHLRSTEKSIRPFGVVVGALELLWEFITRLGEHTILAWVADNLGSEIAHMESLKWAIEHPWMLLLVSAVLYYLFIVAVAHHSTKTNNSSERPGNSTQVVAHGDNSKAMIAHGDLHYHEGSNVLQNIQPAEGVKRPRVVVCQYCRTDYEEKLMSGYREFLLLSNDGDEAAQDIKIETVRIDGWNIDFNRPSTIPARSTARVNVKAISKTTGYDDDRNANVTRSDFLDTAWRDALTADAGFEKARLLIEYCDFSGRVFWTLCAIERDPTTRGDFHFVISGCRDEVLPARRLDSGGQSSY